MSVKKLDRAKLRIASAGVFILSVQTALVEPLLFSLVFELNRLCRLLSQLYTVQNVTPETLYGFNYHRDADLSATPTGSLTDVLSKPVRGKYQ